MDLEMVKLKKNKKKTNKYLNRKMKEEGKKKNQHFVFSAALLQMKSM